MADYVVPVDWKFNGSQADQTTFTLPGHTVAQPRLAIFDRKVPSFNGNGSKVPSYRVRVVRGVVDAEGHALPTRVTADITIRWPLEAAPADVKSDMAAIAAVLADVDFQGDVVDEQLLPR